MNICPECKSKATVNSSDRISDYIVRRYYQCSDVHCGHTFRCTESFDHTLSPPAGKHQQLLLGLLQQMPEGERNELINQLG